METPEDEPQIHSLAVPRTARFATLGNEESPSRIWFLCHGYGQLASDFLVSARALAGPNKLLVAPEALSRFYLDEHRKVGASWMTREDRLNEIADYVRYLDRVHDQIVSVTNGSNPRLGVLGFSQGVATAARWAVRGRAAIDHAVFWGAAIPPELSLEELGGVRMTLVGGSRDPFYGEEVWSDERRRLTEARVAFEELHFQGGHRLDDETLEKLDKLDER